MALRYLSLWIKRSRPSFQLARKSLTYSTIDQLKTAQEIINSLHSKEF